MQRYPNQIPSWVGAVGAIGSVVLYLLLVIWSFLSCEKTPVPIGPYPLLPCVGYSYALAFLFIPMFALSTVLPDAPHHPLAYSIYLLSPILCLVSIIPVANLGASLAMKRYKRATAIGVIILLCTALGWFMLKEYSA